MHGRSFSNDVSLSSIPLDKRSKRRGHASVSLSGPGIGTSSSMMNATNGNEGPWPPTTATATGESHTGPYTDKDEDMLRARNQSVDLNPDSTLAHQYAGANFNTGLDAEDQRPVTPAAKAKTGAAGVTWMSLPRKDQLLVLFAGRLVDFLQVASLQAYVFYQLRDMNRELSDSQISQQAGLLQGCFTGAQVCTAILWGKAADASWCGRKWVLVIGFAGTAISCLGYGFATTFFWAAFWRIFGGAINGTVGIM